LLKQPRCGNQKQPNQQPSFEEFRGTFFVLFIKAHWPTEPLRRAQEPKKEDNTLNLRVIYSKSKLLLLPLGLATDFKTKKR